MQRLFVEGATIILRSRASGKSLRIRDGTVEGNGGEGRLGEQGRSVGRGEGGGGRGGEGRGGGGKGEKGI